MQRNLANGAEHRTRTQGEWTAQAREVGDLKKGKSLSLPFRRGKKSQMPALIVGGSGGRDPLG